MVKLEAVVLLVLEVLGLLLVAAGLAVFVATWIGLASLAVAGVVVLGVAWWAARRL